MSDRIYFDHHATTPIDSEVLKAMRPYLEEEFGNASSSTHDWGRRAKEAVEDARESVAALIGALPQEIVFTSGATEANNLAIKGVVRATSKSPGHMITTAIEHKSVLLSVLDLEREGYKNTVVGTEKTGIVSVEAIEGAIRDDTILVSVMAANSEIGTLQPIEEIGRLCRERGVLFHTDATQQVGKLPLDVTDIASDLLSMSSHKFYGPKGVGALYVRTGVEIAPLFSGGGQEHGIRSGTLNVAGIVGLGAAARVRMRDMEREAQDIQELRNRLWRGIKSEVAAAKLNGVLEPRLPCNLNVCFPGCDAEHLIEALGSFALSTGSACQSKKDGPSDVLVAIGRDAEMARSAVRFGLGKGNTAEQLDHLIEAVTEAVRDAQRLAAS